MKISCAIALLKTEKIVFITATLMINKPLNLTGVLALLWKPEFATATDLAIDDYEAAKEDMKVTARNTSDPQDIP